MFLDARFTSGCPRKLQRDTVEEVSGVDLQQFWFVKDINAILLAGEDAPCSLLRQMCAWLQRKNWP